MHYLVKYQCLKSNYWKQDYFCNTYLKKLTTGNNVFIISDIIYSNCRIIHFLYQVFNVSALLLDYALLTCVVTEVVLFSIVAFKTLTFHNVV